MSSFYFAGRSSCPVGLLPRAGRDSALPTQRKSAFEGKAHLDTWRFDKRQSALTGPPITVASMRKSGIIFFLRKMFPSKLCTEKVDHELDQWLEGSLKVKTCLEHWNTSQYE